jgi:hypothetical protein
MFLGVDIPTCHSGPELLRCNAERLTYHKHTSLYTQPRACRQAMVPEVRSTSFSMVVSLVPVEETLQSSHY